jgi:2'-5' RNA ligase
MDFLSISRRVATNRISTIHTDPNKLFFYIPFPKDLGKKYQEMGSGILGESAKENDHLTLLYLKDQSKDVVDNCLPGIKEDLKNLVKGYGNIHAKVQGWAYFDGAKDDNDSPSTALVALIDAPGLEDLHVDVKRCCKKHGLDVTQNHGFNCHTTFGYLPHGHRMQDLPLLDGEFDINKFCLSNDRVYEYPFNK